MPGRIGGGVIVVLLALASGVGCKKLDSFPDAGPPDTRPGDTVSPGETGPVDVGADAIQVPTTWVTTFGDATTISFVGEDIGVDASGNIYVSGWLWGKATIGQTTLGGGDLESQVVVKLDPHGKPLWARQVSPVDMRNTSDVLVGPPFNLGFALDSASGASYLTGTFSGSITVGTTPLTSAGKKDVYVAKLDKDGKWLWVVSGGGPEDDIAHAVALTGYGPVVAGDFQGTASFGSTSFTSQGGADIFVAQLDYANGAWVNALAAGSWYSDADFGISCNAETAWTVTPTGSGTSVYVAGHLQPGATFGSETVLDGLTFVARADLPAVKPYPSWRWINSLFLPNWSILADRNSADVFVGAQITGAGENNGPWFIARDGETGEHKWSFSIRSPPWGAIFALAQDAAGDVYAGGAFAGTLQLADHGLKDMTAANLQDAFVVKVDPNEQGKLTWARQISSTQWVSLRGLAVGPDGAIYATGGFTGQATLEGKTVAGKASKQDGFVWKLAP